MARCKGAGVVILRDVSCFFFFSQNLFLFSSEVHSKLIRKNLSTFWV